MQWYDTQCVAPNNAPHTTKDVSPPNKALDDTSYVTVTSCIL